MEKRSVYKQYVWSLINAKGNFLNTRMFREIKMQQTNPSFMYLKTYWTERQCINILNLQAKSYLTLLQPQGPQ